MKIFFIVNPLAGNGERHAQIASQIEKLSCKEDCEIYDTKAVGDAMEFVKNWADQHPTEEARFIACGGDGTVNEVFNGAAFHDNISVSIFPCGSGNDFVKAFGGSENFLDMEKLVTAPTRKLDLMKVGDRYANNVTNFGFDTTVAIKVNEDRAKTGHGSKNSYTKGILKALITSMKNHFTVTVDGKVLNPEGKALLCTIANGQYVGGSFKCAPKSKSDDGLLDVCLVRCISRFRFVKLLAPYTAGEHLDNESFSKEIVYCQGKTIRVQSTDSNFAYSLDGEIIYSNDFTVEVVPGAVNLAVPE